MKYSLGIYFASQWGLKEAIESKVGGACDTPIYYMFLKT